MRQEFACAETDKTVLPLAAFVERSRVNGPGIRSVVWVQGCPLCCAGCFNPDFRSFDGGTQTAVDELADRIIRDPVTEGVTFSGGEPFAHAGSLSLLAEKVRTSGKGVVVFTGYRRSELQQSRQAAWQRLLAASDLLAAGPYEEDKPQRHSLLSSFNQELVFLTDRYRYAVLAPPNRCGEVLVRADGSMVTSGFLTCQEGLNK